MKMSFFPTELWVVQDKPSNNLPLEKPCDRRENSNEGIISSFLFLDWKVFEVLEDKSRRILRVIQALNYNYQTQTIEPNPNLESQLPKIKLCNRLMRYFFLWFHFDLHEDNTFLFRPRNKLETVLAKIPLGIRNIIQPNKHYVVTSDFSQIDDILLFMKYVTLQHPECFEKDDISELHSYVPHEWTGKWKSIEFSTKLLKHFINDINRIRELQRVRWMENAGYNRGIGVSLRFTFIDITEEKGTTTISSNGNGKVDTTIYTQKWVFMPTAKLSDREIERILGIDRPR